MFVIVAKTRNRTRGAMLPTNASIEELHLLQRAARKGRHDLVASLIMNGADINATDANGHTAAHQAARNGRVQVLEVLHALGADLGKCSARGVSVAHQAAFGGHLPFLQRLVDFNVRVDLVDANDWTPLEIALHEKRWHVVEYLEKVYSERVAVPTLDPELLALLAPPTPTTAAAMLHQPALSSASSSSDDDDVEEMNKSSQRLHALLPFSLLDAPHGPACKPSTTGTRPRKRKMMQLLADAAALSSLPSTPTQDHDRLHTKHSALFPPIASPSLQHKIIPGNKGTGWREKRRSLQQPDELHPALATIPLALLHPAASDVLGGGDADDDSSTVHHLLYDM
ncbi:Aste57867_11934 [Aphanomyces stellatus]|uniref:Aste57867_11934 protein n=1 Tax=Aphanomyces stellatus TaxID=120398 RepID=A0A485KVG9_9STRA|nr:hypothetical protein As57867_011889 [Aphanomyces stellatus]VFT88789.1 Aste57867_11934 [Aphanomyces stellatus]